MKYSGVYFFLIFLVFASCDFKTEEQEKVQAFVKEYPEVFADMVSKNYKLTEEIVDRRLGKLEEDLLYKNDSTIFTEKMFEQIFISERRYYYKKERDWVALSQKRNLPWSVPFVEKYKDKWLWKSEEILNAEHRSLSANPAVVGSPEIMRAFKDRWDWGIMSREPYGETVSWDIDLLREFSDFIWWGFLSDNIHVNWNEEIIDEFSGKWDQFIYSQEVGLLQNLSRNDNKWGGLSENPSLPWSVSFIDKYQDKWDWVKLSYNEGLPWSVELIERYKDKWDWSGLSRNKGIKWDGELINRCENRIDLLRLYENENVVWTTDMLDKYFSTIKQYWYHIRWDGFSRNENTLWTADLLEKYKEYLWWGVLSDNPKLPWSGDLIKQFFPNWDWSALSQSKVIPWSTEIIGAGIDSGKGYWNWQYLSANSSLPMSDPDFFERYLDYWDWQLLLCNESLPWSVDFLRKYEDRFKEYWHSGGCITENITLWNKSFAPYLDDDFVIELLGYDTKKLPQ